MQTYIGKNIRHLRLNRNLSQEDLSNKLGLASSQVGSYERGKSYPRFEGLIELARIFEVSLDDLVYRDIEKEGTTDEPDLNKRDKELFVELLMKRLKEMEREIKEQSPELAKRLNIE